MRTLQRDIRRGKLRSGQRLPTHRELARSLEVATGTVTRAYAEAESRNLIHGEVGRGTFVGGRSAPTTSLGTPDQNPSKIIELSVDLPIHAYDPDLAGVLRDIAARPDRGELLRYHTYAGTLRHRRAGSAWLSRYGLTADPEQVLLCSGTQHALLVILMTLSEPGGVVLTEELTYPGLRAVAQHLHLRVEGLPVDEHGIIPETFAKSCMGAHPQALYCIPSLHNPTTACMPLVRRREIAAIAAEHGVPIIEDEAHRHLAEDPPTPFGAMIPKLAYTATSMSKSLTGGLRVAFLTAPESAIGRLTEAIWATTWMVPTLNAEIVATWIEDGTADKVARAKRREAIARQRLAARIFGDFQYRAQPASYYLWLALPEVWTSSEFTFEARRRGVAVTPSEAFTMPGQTAPRAVRVCIGAAENRKALGRGLEILAELLSGKRVSRRV